MGLGKITRGENCLYLFALLTLFVLSGCKKSDNGFSLQKFKVVNGEFYQVINQVSDEIHKNPPKDCLLILELRQYDSIPEFWFLYKSQNVINHEIYKRNWRIVGYLNFKSDDIIVLSNLNNLEQFERTFYKFIMPTDELKLFNCIYFDSHQYDVDKNGNPIPDFVLSHPTYKVYIYEKNRFQLIQSQEWFNAREH